MRLKLSSQKSRDKTWRGWCPGGKNKEKFSRRRKPSVASQAVSRSGRKQGQALTFRSNTVEVTGNLRDSFNGAMGSKLGKSGFKRKIPGDNRRQ